MEIPTHPDALLSIDQTAYLLGMETRTLKRWIREKKGPLSFKTEGRRKWRLQTVTDWIRREEIRGTIGTVSVPLGTPEEKPARRVKDHS